MLHAHKKHDQQSNQAPWLLNSKIGNSFHTQKEQEPILTFLIQFDRLIVSPQLREQLLYLHAVWTVRLAAKVHKLPSHRAPTYDRNEQTTAQQREQVQEEEEERGYLKTTTGLVETISLGFGKAIAFPSLSCSTEPTR